MLSPISMDTISDLFTSALAEELSGASRVAGDAGATEDSERSLTWRQCLFSSSKDVAVFVGVPDELESITVSALPKALEALGRKLSERTGLKFSGPSITSSEPAEGCEQSRISVSSEDGYGEIVFAIPLGTLTFLESVPPQLNSSRVEPPVAMKPKHFEFLMGLDLPMKISFGTATLPLSDILKLSVGSMVELNRRHKDPVDIVVNDRVLARGEVVDVDGNYGVRVLEVCDWP